MAATAMAATSASAAAGAKRGNAGSIHRVRPPQTGSPAITRPWKARRGSGRLSPRTASRIRSSMSIAVLHFRSKPSEGPVQARLGRPDGDAERLRDLG